VPSLPPSHGLSLTHPFTVVGRGHVRVLSLVRLIYGFLTRVDVNNALNGQEPGTFLLRYRITSPSRDTQHTLSLSRTHRTQFLDP
jgi:hypothetical protein